MLINNEITRFPNGVTNVPVSDIFNSLRMSDPSLYHQYLQDFDQYIAGDWTVTETQAGATQALAAGGGGIIVLTNTAADNDIVQIQKNPAAFQVAVGRKFFMRTLFSLSDVVQSDFAIGIQLANVDGTTLATATDGIFFLKADGAATVNFYVRRDNTTGSVVATSIATLVNDTQVALDCFYDGGDRVYYAVNGTVTGYVTVSASILPNVICAPIVSLKNGEAVAKVADIDRLFVINERLSGGFAEE